MTQFPIIKPLSSVAKFRNRSLPSQTFVPKINNYKIIKNYQSGRTKNQTDHNVSQVTYKHQSQYYKDNTNQQQPYANIIKKFISLWNFKHQKYILTQLISLLQQNIFFKKIGKFLSNFIINECSIVQKHHGEKIFSKGQHIKYIYIIIYGKVKIKNKINKRYLINGETLCEEIIFNYKPSVDKVTLKNTQMVHQQSAYCQFQSLLLKFSVSKYVEMGKQLLREGYKNDFLKLQNVLKLNYLSKQLLKRSKQSEPSLYLYS